VNKLGGILRYPNSYALLLLNLLICSTIGVLKRICLEDLTVTSPTLIASKSPNMILFISGTDFL
jgi:hypothetical protein